MSLTSGVSSGNTTMSCPNSLGVAACDCTDKSEVSLHVVSRNKSPF